MSKPRVLVVGQKWLGPDGERTILGLTTRGCVRFVEEPESWYLPTIDGVVDKGVAWKMADPEDETWTYLGGNDDT